MKLREKKPPFTIALVIVSIIVFTVLYFSGAHLVPYLTALLVFLVLLIFLLIKSKRDEIAKQKRTEEHLLDFNRQLEMEVKEKTIALQHIFERVSDAFVAVDTKWRYTYLNKKAAELLSRPGLSPESLAGKYIFSVIPEAEGSLFHKLGKEAMDTQEYRYVEDYDPRHERWLANHIYPSAEGLSVFFRDITAKKKAEEMLQISEEKYRMLIEQASEGVFIFTHDWRCLEVNPNACKMTGYTMEELLQMKVTDLVFPEDLEQTPPRVAELNAGKIVSSVRKMRKKDGTEYYGESVARMMPDGRIVSFVRDITERKKAEIQLRESEEKYRSVIEQASDAIMLADQAGNFLEVNDSFCKQFGYSSHELIGTSVSLLLDPDHLKVNPIRIDLLLDGQSLSRERKAIHKNGTPVDIEVNSKMLADGRLLAIIRDVTARKKAEEALRRSEKEYISWVNTIDGIVWEADAQTFAFSFVSKQAERLLGYPAPQWIEEPDFWSSHIYEEDREFAVNYCVNSTRAKEPHTFEYRMVAADGRIVWLRDIVSVIVENDAPVKLRGLMIDITLQKEVELQLREAEVKFRNLVEKSLVGVYIIQNGTFAYVNPKIAEIYGYTQDEIVGHPLSLLADEEEMKKVNDNIRLRLTGKKESVQYEITGKKKDGSSLQVEVYGSKTTYKGEPAIIGTLIDITERKKIAEELRLSGEKYKLMFDNSPLPMFMYSTPDYTIIDVNEAAVRHYGFTKEEFLRMNVKDLRPPEDVPLFLEKAAETARGHMGVWRHKKKDGSTILVEIIAHDIIFQDVPVRLTLANDITEKVEAEERLQQSYTEIRMLASHIEQVREEEKIKIAQEIHDELGQKITALKMDVSWLSKRVDLNDKAIANNIKEILEMLDETVKTVRRIATELRPGILDDLGLVAAMEWQSREFEKRSGIKTEFYCNTNDIKFGPDLSTGLFRIFQESLTNVARHAEAGRVTACLNKIDDEITLNVRDDGKGFDVSAIGQKRTLGLLGMKERVMMMGGKYELSSEKGKGTTVAISVKLPARQEYMM